MLLRPTEACILLLVFFQTCYSLKKQLCINANMACAQGQGLCKPECMKGEERIGFCHGLSCFCCKTPQPEILKSPIAILGAAVNVITEPNTRSHGRISHSHPEGGAMDNKSSPAAMKMTGTKSGSPDQGNMSKKRVTSTKKGGDGDNHILPLDDKSKGSMERGWGSAGGGGGGWRGSGIIIPGGGGWSGRGVGREGSGGGGRGPVTDFREGVRCEFEGNFYADRAEWTMDCMEHKCVDGHISSKLSDNCCEFEEKKYCDGDIWSRFCTVYSCGHGHIDSKDDEHCCEHEGKLYLSGDSWTEGCYDLVCHMGRIQENMITSCCEDNGVLYESGQTWTEVCDHFKCNNGMIARSDVDTCCSGPGGVMKPSGETWRNGCMDLTCHDGNIEEKIAPALCCEHENDLKDNGATWQSECDIYTCINGLVKTVPIPHECCEVNGERKMNGDSWEFDSCHTSKCFMGNIVKEFIEDLCCPYEGSIKENGENWITGCDKFTCVKGEIQNEMSPNCCVDDSLVYEESAIVHKNECEVHECKCTEAGCRLLMTDDSQCEKEDLKAETKDYVILEPTYTTRTPIKDRLYHKLMEKLKGVKAPPEDKKVYNKLLTNLNKYKTRPVPPMACRYNNTWMLHGTTLIEGCFKIMCEGGCTCYEMLQHGCCYNNDTEHMNEGELWEENCIFYTCLDKQITMTNSTSPACLPEKRNGCMYGGMEYSNGETIAYGCSIHRCEMGRFVSYPDPTCCVVDGSAYPSGSKWQDECFTYICDMGLIKKSDRGICKEDCTDSCQGSQVEVQMQLQQMQQPQPCQYCCMVGDITVQSGQTWMDNCNAHSCNQGIISTSFIANCK